MKDLFAIAGLICFAGSVFAQSGEALVVPFDTLKSRHMVVMVKVNDQGPFQLIFDTGAPTTLVSQKLAKAVGVIDKTKNTLSVFGNLGQKKLDKLEMGPITLTKVDTMVMDHPVVEVLAKSLNQPIDGIIGFNIFARYDMTIDYQKKTMTFVPSKYRPADMMQSMMSLMFPSLNDLERIPVVAPLGVMGFRAEAKKGDTDSGIPIVEVFQASPAARAGLKSGDRLLTLDGRWTDRVEDIFEAAKTLRPGQPARLEILRGGAKQVVQVVIAPGF